MESSFSGEFKRTWLTTFIGLILTGIGVHILAWNERHTVSHTTTLNEVYNQIIPLNLYEPIWPEYEGRLVHLQGPLVIDEPLTEPDYGISIQAVKLKRRVQMFQWVESENPLDFSVDAKDPERKNNYYYVTEWRDKLVNSNSFYIKYGHHNPTSMPLTSKVYVSPAVRVGHLQLGEEMKELFNDWVEMTSDERPDRRDVKLHMGIYYHCDDVWKPEVGDIRVQFYHAGHIGDIVSMIGQQKNGVLEPYVTNDSKHKILMLRYGQLTLEQMFDMAKADVIGTAWKYRFIAFVAIFFGGICLRRLLIILLRKIPFLRRLRIEDNAQTNFIFTLFLGALIMTLSWIFQRPWIGVTFFVISFAPIYYILP